MKSINAQLTPCLFAAEVISEYEGKKTRRLLFTVLGSKPYQLSCKRGEKDETEYKLGQSYTLSVGISIYNESLYTKTLTTSTPTSLTDPAADLVEPVSDPVDPAADPVDPAADKNRKNR